MNVIEQVIALHKSDGGHNPICECGIEPGSGAVCVECRSAFPCATITAIMEGCHLKRLTEAELSAEYWAAHGEANATMTGNLPLLFSRRHALRRFATLPHYDEDQ